MWRMIIVSNYRSIKPGHSVTPKASFLEGKCSKCSVNSRLVKYYSIWPESTARWWQLKYFWNFHPYLGKMNPFWLILFKGIETTNQKRVWICQSYLCWMLDAKGEMLRNSHQILGAMLLSECNELGSGYILGAWLKTTMAKVGFRSNCTKKHVQIMYPWISLEWRTNLPKTSCVTSHYVTHPRAPSLVISPGINFSGGRHQ